MLTLGAGPGGVLRPGIEYERADGAELVAAGAAVDVSPLPELETLEEDIAAGVAVLDDLDPPEETATESEAPEIERAVTGRHKGRHRGRR